MDFCLSHTFSGFNHKNGNKIKRNRHRLFFYDKLNERCFYRRIIFIRSFPSIKMLNVVHVWSFAHTLMLSYVFMLVISHFFFVLLFAFLPFLLQLFCFWCCCLCAYVWSLCIGRLACLLSFILGMMCKQFTCFMFNVSTIYLLSTQHRAKCDGILFNIVGRQKLLRKCFSHTLALIVRPNTIII